MAALRLRLKARLLRVRLDEPPTLLEAAQAAWLYGLRWPAEAD